MTKERILEILDLKGIKKSIFFQKTGIKRGFLDADKLNQSVSDENFAKIIAIFPDVSVEWLITGKGDRLKKVENQTFKPKGIPLIPVEAMAGYGNGDVQVMDYEIQENYILTPEFEGKGIKYLIRVSGSSMVPKYNNGDLLACRPINDLSFIQWGKVYVLDTDQGPLVKRLYPCTINDSTDCLECRSDNFEKYPPFQIFKASIRRIAIVVGVLRLE